MYQSGKPWGRQVRFNGLDPARRPSWSNPSTTRRAAAFNGLDLRLQKALRFGGTVEGAVFGDVLNVFNNDADENISTAGGVRQLRGASRFVLPRRLMIGAKFRF